MSDYAQIFGFGLGALLVGWVVAQAIALAWRSWRRSARWHREYEREHAEFLRQVEATARAARAEKAIAEWSGWRPFRVTAIVDEARDVKSFYFSPVDGRPLLPFAPGQYLTFRIPVPGAATPLVRCYSLSDRPRQDYYRVTVKRLKQPPGRSDIAHGRGSNYFHDRVHVGDLLPVRAPAGTFLVDPHATEPIALVGAGIGITPLVCMIESILHSGHNREIYAIFGFRHGDEHPFKARLMSLAETFPNLHLHISYTAARTTEREHHDYHDRGRITISRIRRVLPSNNFQFYVCGPPQFMEAIVPALWEWGVPDSHVHFEAFGPASIKRTRKSAAGSNAQYQVRFDRTGRTLNWDGSCTSLLEFSEASGISLPSGCRAGSCGECMLGIRSGDTTAIKPPGIPVPAGQCLACITTPASDLVLDA